MPDHEHPVKGSAHSHRHDHTPDPDSATLAIEFNGRVCVVSEGHLFHQNNKGQWEEDVIPVDDDHPDGCSHDFECPGHNDGSICSDDCGHLAVPHGDHTDYLVEMTKGEFELHHPHGDHCDYHGSVKKVPVPAKASKGPAPG